MPSAGGCPRRGWCWGWAVADVWAPLRYGWSHVYWLTVEGIPVVWAERALAKTLPSGYDSESATLAIEGSARVGCMVDRDSGIGAGYPLSFCLIDHRAGDSGASAADYMIRPTAQTYLTSDETSSDATIGVASLTGLTSPVWIGRERVTYAGTAGSTLTGCTRGTVGLPGTDLAYPHRKGAAVTSGAPRHWRGRHVALYAQAVDPTGYAPGTAWTSTSVCIWRGTLDGEPQRSGDGDGWEFTAQSLDRLLARQLSGEWTGETVDSEWRFQVEHDGIRVDWYRYTAAGAETYTPITIFPFGDAGYLKGDWISVTEANAAIEAAYNAAITASGVAWLGALRIVNKPTTYGKSVVNKGMFWPQFGVEPNAQTKELQIKVDWLGVQYGQNAKTYGTPGITGADFLEAGVFYHLSPYAAKDAPMQHASIVTVRLDEGDPGSLPSAGQIDIGGQAHTYKAHVALPAAGLVQFRNLSPVGANVASQVASGATVKVIAADTGTLAGVALRMLQSSGEALLRGASDTLPGQMGYGIPSELIDESVPALLASGWLAALQLYVALSGDALADSLGGLLRLSGRALCVVDGSDADAQLAAIETASGASGAAVELNDDHVITYPGRSASQHQVESPASVVALLKAGKVDCGTIRFIDADRIAAEGAEAAQYDVPVTARSPELLLAVAGWGISRLVGDSMASVVEVDVVPWLDVRPGDAVQITLTLPELWDWAAGAAGYDGRARCVGRDVSLEDGVQRLRLLIDGQAAKGANLCPSTPIVALTGHATTPTTVDIDRAYYAIMTAALVAESPLRLLYYEPGAGAESLNYYLDATAVADTSVVCRLTISAYALPAGGVSATLGWLSWPETATASAWQTQWMHDADDSRWI